MKTSHSLRYFRDARQGIAVATGLAVAATLVEAAGLILVALLAQRVALESGAGSPTSLGPVDLDVGVGQLLVITSLAFVLSTGLQLASNLTRAQMVRRWIAERQRRLLDDFFAADWPTQSTVRSGRLSALNGLVNQVGSNLSNLTVVLRSLASVTVLMIVAVATDWTAAVAIWVLGAALFFGLRPLNIRAKAASRAATRLNVALQEELTDLSSLSRELRIFGVRVEATDRSRELIDEVAEQSRRMDALDTSVPPVYQAAGVLLLVASLGIIEALGSSDLASLGAVALLVLRGISYGQQFQSAWQRFTRTIPVLDQLEEASEQLRRAVVVDGSVDIDRIGELRLDQVGYRYGPEGEPAVTGVTLALGRGRILGVAGRSGAGKSTLAELVLRLRDPTEGVITVDGAPVSTTTLATWHRQVALVPQETTLLRGTVTENIRLFRSWVSPAAVERAAVAAGIHDTILGLPDGYDTELGTDQRGLSGGQKQRIGIARALAGHPSLLVLDEPTSALDLESEAIVHETLAALRDDLAVVVIAHRLSTLSVCDELLVLEAGRTVFQGPPAQVVSNGTIDLALATAVED